MSSGAKNPSSGPVFTDLHIHDGEPLLRRESYLALLVEHLDHLESLGVDVVYLTPFFPARSNHRYDASSFEQIDPLLGGAPALRRLTKAAHERGMKVMGDFTTNHTGNAHEWFLKAAGPGGKNAPERDYYIWEDGTYVAWLGVPSLPKLNHVNAALATAARCRFTVSASPRSMGPVSATRAPLATQ